MTGMSCSRSGSNFVDFLDLGKGCFTHSLQEKGGPGSATSPAAAKEQGAARGPGERENAGPSPSGSPMGSRPRRGPQRGSPSAPYLRHGERSVRGRRCGAAREHRTPISPPPGRGLPPPTPGPGSLTQTEGGRPDPDGGGARAAEGSGRRGVSGTGRLRSSGSERGKGARPRPAPPRPVRPAPQRACVGRGCPGPRGSCGPAAAGVQLRGSRRDDPRGQRCPHRKIGVWGALQTRALGAPGSFPPDCGTGLRSALLRRIVGCGHSLEHFPSCFTFFKFFFFNVLMIAS